MSDSICMSKQAINATNTRVHVIAEAFQSAPLLISVVRDPDGSGDFFHVEDVDSSVNAYSCGVHM